MQNAYYKVTALARGTGLYEEKFTSSFSSADFCRIISMTQDEAIKKMQIDLLTHQQQDELHFTHIEQLMESNNSILKQHDGEFQEIKELIRFISTENEPVNQWFKNITFGKRMLMGFLTIVSVIVGILYGIKYVIYTK